jgi:hypothetical protein
VQCASDEVMSNLNFFTLNLKLEVVVTVAVGTAQVHARNLGRRRSAKHPPQHVGDGEAGGGGAPGSWHTQPAQSRRAGTMI